MTMLALLGGTPVRRNPFPAYRVIGEEEKAAAIRVLDSGVLSRFLGTWHEDFYGGPEVQAFEREWANICQAKHAIAVNSATSGLYAAAGAAGVGPGDEVIVSPYTIVSSAVAPMIFNAVPVFADVDPATYCLDPESIRQRITPRTKAIVVVHIFGQSADMDPIMEIARDHDLCVIEDCAQSPFATYKGRPVGTLGHMGVFSFNYHKHIHTGEGGVITTNDDGLAERCQLIRNHAEAVVAGKGVTDLTNMVGFNFRMGEIEAAIGRCQIEKGGALIAARKRNVAYLESSLSQLPGLEMPTKLPADDHVYYLHALKYDTAMTGVPTKLLADALKAELPVTELREGEGPLVRAGYVKPVYLLDMFQSQTAYGSVNCPFRCPHYQGQVDYREGLCPVVEDLNERTIIHEFMRPPMTEDDLDDVIATFEKVFDNLDELASSPAADAYRND